MTEPDNEPSSEPIDRAQASMLIDQLRDLAHVILHHPPHDVDCAVSYENGSSYYRIDLRWNTPSQPGSITDVDAFLRSLFNNEEGH